MRKLKYIIDRFEGDLVVCQNKETQEIPNLDKSIFPSEAKESDLIEYEDGKVQILDSTSLKAKIRKRMRNLWK